MAFWRASGRSLTNATLLLLVLATGVAILEFASRVLVPISPGTRFVDLQGKLAEFGADELPVSFTFRQISPDFDVIGHTDANGNRAPSSPDPSVIFLGDSFTFGQGLADDETFAALFCRRTQEACVNLGRPGTGTFRQVRLLEQQLAAHCWRPREVKLFVLAMSSSLMAGNDFADTPDELHKWGLRVPPTTEAVAEVGAGGREWGGGRLYRWILDRRTLFLAKSNLARLVYARFGPLVRSLLADDASPDMLARGMQAVAGELDRLGALSRQYGFRYTIYVLYPMQDLLRGTYPQTEAAVRAAAGGAEVVGTALALTDHITDYYFPYDGHLSAAGARRIAEFLQQGH